MIKRHVRYTILYGQDAKKIGQVIGDKETITYTDSLKKAVAKAASIVHKGEQVLLSPACTSWDMFKDYQERGNLFMQYVRKSGIKGL